MADGSGGTESPGDVGVRAHDADTKLWSIVTLAVDEAGATVDIGLMDAETAEPGTLAHRLARFSARHLVGESSFETFGGSPFRTIPLMGTDGAFHPIAIRMSTTWAELMDAPPTLAWSWRFLTPTAFSRKEKVSESALASEQPLGNTTLDPTYSAHTVLTDLQESFAQFAATAAATSAASTWNSAETSFYTSAADLRIVAAAPPRPTGFTGWASHRARAMNASDTEHVAQAIGTLLAFGPYRGVGTHTTRGNGQLIVESSEAFMPRAPRA
jgi:hypothetical protein